MANNYKIKMKDIQNKYKFKIFATPGEKGETGEIGTPLVASSISGMTDTTRNYINTTNGHWYWYNGTTWVDGGTYQATGLADEAVNIDTLDDDVFDKIFTKRHIDTVGWHHYSNKYIRISSPLLLRKGETITFGATFLTNYKYRIGKYPSVETLGNWNNLTNYINTPATYTIPETGIYTILVSNNDTDTLDDAEFTTNDIDLTYYIKEDEPVNYKTFAQSFSELVSNLTYSAWKYNGNYMNRDTEKISMTRAYKSDKPIKVSLKNPENYNFSIIYFTAPFVKNANRVGSGGGVSWTNVPFTIPSNQYFIIEIIKNPTGKITLAEGKEQLIIEEDYTYVKDIEDTLDLQDERLDAIENTLGIFTEIPSYWETQINSKIETIKALEMQTDATGDSFIFITDVHWQSNKKNSPLLIKKLLNSVNLKKVIFGGDVLNLNSTKEAAIDYVNNFFNNFKNVEMYNILGNHDFNDNVGGTYPNAHLTANDVYSMMFKSFENRVDYIARPLDNVRDNRPNYFYYCVDNKVQKIRYIMLNTLRNSYGSTQLNWLLSKLQELDSSWTIILFTHFIYSGLTGETPNKSTSYTELNTFLTNNVSSYSCTIAAIIGGHSHYDYSETNELGIVLICTATDAYKLSDTILSPTMTAGTDTEQLFDVFTIDTLNRTINATRIGAGSDRTFTY